MKSTVVSSDGRDGQVFHILTDFAVDDLEAFHRSEHEFKAVMSRVIEMIAVQITAELLPRVKDYILTRINIEQLVQDAAKQRVSELLFPVKP